MGGVCGIRRGKLATKKTRYIIGDRLNIDQRFVVTMDEQQHYMDKRNNVHVIPASKFLMALIYGWCLKNLFVRAGSLKILGV